MTDFLPANGVFGRGTIDGRPVVIFGDDFTVRGGSADASIKDKYFMPEKMAGEYRMPLIRMIEGSGGGGSVKTIETRGHANLPGGIGQSSGLWLCAQNMGRVPVVAMGLGSVAGLGAARLAASHYSLMVKDTSAIFVAGPPVVERLGEKRTKQQLGGHQVQVRGRHGRRCGRYGRGSIRTDPAVPVLPAVLGVGSAAAATFAATIRTGATSI